MVVIWENVLIILEIMKALLCLKTIFMMEKIQDLVVSSGSKVKGYKIVNSNENVIKQTLATVGPLAVAINASPKSFNFYKSGVYNDKSCVKTVLNHGVVLVGYGTDKIAGD